MVPQEELKSLSITEGVPLTNIEKDYVMGWLLWGIYNNPVLAENLILKGGNCLRKIYFPDTRFSDDLDFTTYELDSEQRFHEHLDSVCDKVTEASGIVFDKERTNVELKDTPIQEQQALEGRVYFKGFAGDSSLTMRIKFDVSEYEKIILPLQTHPMIHNFSDTELCRVEVLSYSLEEILAEKLRSWVQRTRSRDLFDVVKIVESGRVPISKTNVLSTFFQKTIYKNVPMSGKEELLFEKKFEDVSSTWDKTIICSTSALMVASNAIGLFKNFIQALFQPEILSAIGATVGIMPSYSYNINSGFREAIIEAGRQRMLIKLRYHGRDRDIEPYSFRYKSGREYFYGYDRTRGQIIKSFFLEGIEGVSVIPQQYSPRWAVEF